MEELDGLRLGPLALLGLHQAENHDGHDEEGDDQHASLSSRDVPENRRKTGVFAPEGRIVISEFVAAGAIL
jgi:hypothetical protein